MSESCPVSAAPAAHSPTFRRILPHGWRLPARGRDHARSTFFVTDTSFLSGDFCNEFADLSVLGSLLAANRRLAEERLHLLRKAR